MKRLNNETFEDFKAKRILQSKVDKIQQKGHIVWPKDPKSGKTYVKKLHGELI